MTGKQLSDAIVDLAHTLGYIAAHFAGGQVRPGSFVTNYSYDSKGFPDLVLVSKKRRRVVYIEVKGKGDSLRPEQAIWLSELAFAGAEARMVTVSDWKNGSVEEFLAC